jgi:hypothetical protein
MNRHKSKYHCKIKEGKIMNYRPRTSEVGISLLATACFACVGIAQQNLAAYILAAGFLAIAIFYSILEMKEQRK